MPVSALALLLTAAVLHASWNLLVKQSRAKEVFTWLSLIVGSLCFLPVLVLSPALPARAWPYLVVSAAVEAAYFFALTRAYSLGDFSLVYPLARGTGPLLSTGAAIVVFSERPSALALAGGAIIVVAVFSLAGAGSGAGAGSERGAGSGARVDALHRRHAIGFALLTGVAIASYTLWDKQAVGPLGLSPIVYYWGANVAETALLTPFVAHRRAEVRRTWHAYRRQVLGVALLSPLAYILVLFALAHAPVSYVAPARELSILVGAVAGITVLDEGHPRRRMLAAAAIFAGIVALAVG